MKYCFEEFELKMVSIIENQTKKTTVYEISKLNACTKVSFCIREYMTI